MIRWVLIAAAVWAAACQSVPRAYVVPEGPYGEALRHATREAIVRRGFDTALIAYATFDSPAFREARAQRLARIFEVPPPEAEGRAGALAQGGPGPSFIVAVYTGARFANELEKPAAVWGFHLKTPAGSFVPSRIRRLAHTHSLETLYPFADNFFATYRVDFPAEAAGAAPRLSLSGPAGEASFAFD